MNDLHREPLVHFLVLGALTFGLFVVIGDEPVGSGRQIIEVTEADAGRLTRQFEAAVGRPPSETELSDLIGSYIREEVLVREARALSFDRDDEVVRQRLIQKMQFLIESGAEAAVPTVADLRAHFEENLERFVEVPMVAFEQVLLEPADGNANAVLAALRSGGEPKAPPQASPLPKDIPPVSKQVVDGTFGDGFFDRIAEFEVGQWSGPVESAYGAHLVRVVLIDPGRRPPFDDIRDEVEKDWRLARAQERFEAILARYEIRRPDLVDAGTK